MDVFHGGVFLFSGKEGMDMKWNKTMRQVTVIVMVAAAAAGLTGCGTEKKTSAVMGDAKVAKVGFLNGVTGGVAAYGIAEKEGFDLAVEEVNRGEKYISMWRWRIRREISNRR